MSEKTVFNIQYKTVLLKFCCQGTIENLVNIFSEYMDTWSLRKRILVDDWKISIFIISQQNTSPEGIFQLGNKSSLLRETIRKHYILNDFA